jgi:hypothetical protein
LLLPVDDTDDTDASDKNEARDDERGPDETTKRDDAARMDERDNRRLLRRERLFDVVLASDVLYDESSAVPLAETLCELLKTRPSQDGTETQKPRTTKKKNVTVIEADVFPGVASARGDPAQSLRRRVFRGGVRVAKAARPRRGDLRVPREDRLCHR